MQQKPTTSPDATAGEPAARQPVPLATPLPPALLSNGMALVWALGAAVLYFLAARAGLSLLVKPSNVAVFWPASGVGAGLMIMAGTDPRARLAVAGGIFSATAAANLLGDRNIALAVVFGHCNAFEALLFAGLMQRVAGVRPFASIQEAIWFLFSAAASAGAMAILASASLVLMRPASGSFLGIWLDWWASDAVGIIIFAPMLMVVAREMREPRLYAFDAPHGLWPLVALVGVAALIYLASHHSLPEWSTVPVAALFPFLLWLGARSRPLDATAGILIVGLIVVFATTHDLGPFGDKLQPWPERILNVRLTLVSVAFCGLMMVAVFTQQRSAEAILRANQARVDRLAASAPGMIYSFHIAKNGYATMPYASAAIGHVLGTTAEIVAKNGLVPFRNIKPADRPAFDASVARSRSEMKTWMAEFRYLHPERGEIWIEGHAAPVEEDDGSVTWHGFLQDVSQRKRAEENVKLLMGEVNHRANNLLSVVQAVVFQTARQGVDSKQFADVLDKRIDALAVSHTLLVAGHWHGVRLDELVRRQLLFIGDLVGTRIEVSGPVALLKSAATQVIGMALHELATNALKYGAISTAKGRIRISWSSAGQFEMTWRESDGPVVSPPLREGFGSRVLLNMAEHQLDAEVRLDFDASGLIWSLTAPLDRVLEGEVEARGPAERLARVD